MIIEWEIKDPEVVEKLFGPNSLKEREPLQILTVK